MSPNIIPRVTTTLFMLFCMFENSMSNNIIAKVTATIPGGEESLMDWVTGREWNGQI